MSTVETLFAREPVPDEHLDVLVVGAGISGISAGYYLQRECPDRTYAILESRDAIGGTWDLFRYPGIRSDSDLLTFGFSFRPWTGEKTIADGASILAYLKDTARHYGIDTKIRFGTRVVAADWDETTARWTVEIEAGPERTRRAMSCSFLYACAGYYDYDSGHTPEIPGIADFAGRVVHPQAWPEDLDHAGKRIVVIGSGATAVTLVPELARTAAHVTMLQRSPTYVISMPARDRFAAALRRRLPARIASALARWRSIGLGIAFYQFARRRPDAMSRIVLKGVRRQLGPDYDVGKHFTPRYKPWDERLCIVPDGDLFKAIRSGTASVETDVIQTVEADGIRLASGAKIPADMIVTATGLKLKMAGGIALSVGGVPVDPVKSWLYKGMMLSDVPNFAVAIGYTNASWTLKCELTSRYVCRLLNRLGRNGDDFCVPRPRGDEGETPTIDFTSGYIQRAKDLLPKQGVRRPWRLHQNYVLDVAMLRFGRVDDGVMAFGARTPPSGTAASLAKGRSSDGL